jgi:hypothetical protein
MKIPVLLILECLRGGACGLYSIEKPATMRLEIVSYRNQESTYER